MDQEKKSSQKTFNIKDFEEEFLELIAKYDVPACFLASIKKSPSDKLPTIAYGGTTAMVEFVLGTMKRANNN